MNPSVFPQKAQENIAFTINPDSKLSVSQSDLDEDIDIDAIQKKLSQVRNRDPYSDYDAFDDGTEL